MTKQLKIKKVKNNIEIFYTREIVNKIFITSIEKIETSWKVKKVIWGKRGLKLICKIE